MTWFSVKDTGSIPRVLSKLYGRMINLELESLEMSVTEIYQIRSLPQAQAVNIVAVLCTPQKFVTVASFLSWRVASAKVELYLSFAR